MEETPSKKLYITDESSNVVTDNSHVRIGIKDHFRNFIRVHQRPSAVNGN
jgi:hypothetical protein